MIQQPTITYIKNGVEKTVTINMFNKKRILKEIYEASHIYGRWDDWIHYKIKADIDFIHFKNFPFQQVRIIECPEDTICILENCVFQNQKSYELKIRGGNFEFINPTLKEIGEISSRLQDVKDLSIIITTKPNNQKQKVQLNVNSTIRTISIKDNQNLNNLNVYSLKALINGNLKLDELNLAAYHIAIGNKEEKTSIIVDQLRTSIIADKKMELKNCTIAANSKMFETFYIEADNLEVEQVALKARKKVVINNCIYHKKENDSELVITDKDLSRTNLISVLKGLRDQVHSQIEVQGQQYLKDSHQEEKKQIEIQKEKIKETELMLQEQQLELINLEKNLETKQAENGKALVKSLSKKPINKIK